MYHSGTYWLPKIPQAIRKLDDLETEKYAATVLQLVSCRFCTKNSFKMV